MPDFARTCDGLGHQSLRKYRSDKPILESFEFGRRKAIIPMAQKRVVAEKNRQMKGKPVRGQEVARASPTPHPL
jgi:hypothetical protein